MSDSSKCPFCGADIYIDILDSFNPCFRVRCKGSKGHALDMWCDTVKEALEEWDTRAPSPIEAIAYEMARALKDYIKVEGIRCTASELLDRLRDLDPERFKREVAK